MKEANFLSYVDDNTLYRTANTVNEVMKLLEHGSMMLFKWFSDNQILVNVTS